MCGYVLLFIFGLSGDADDCYRLVFVISIPIVVSEFKEYWSMRGVHCCSVPNTRRILTIAVTRLDHTTDHGIISGG